MKVELSTPTLIKISWPLYDTAIDAEIRQRLATVPGIEVGRGRCCWAPAIQLWRLTEIFPKASFDYAAMQAADRLAHSFWDSMVSMGVIFRIDPMGAVYVASESVSPVVEQLVADRSHALKPLVEEAMRHPGPALVSPLHGPQTLDDGKWETWLKGVHNAAAKEELEKVRYPRRKPKKSKKTKGLEVS